MTQATFQQGISEFARRDVIDELLLRDSPFNGKFDVIEFLALVWDLEAIPSTDSRYPTMRQDIAQHIIFNEDWTFEELLLSKLHVLDLPDRKFLDFVEA